MAARDERVSTEFVCVCVTQVIIYVGKYLHWKKLAVLEAAAKEVRRRISDQSNGRNWTEQTLKKND